MLLTYVVTQAPRRAITDSAQNMVNAVRVLTAWAGATPSTRSVSMPACLRRSANRRRTTSITQMA